MTGHKDHADNIRELYIINALSIAARDIPPIAGWMVTTKNEFMASSCHSSKARLLVFRQI
jgi:hypothetical protein